MEPRTSFVTKMEETETVLGTVLKSVSTNVAEALGYTPVEFLFVDRQHGSPVTEKLEALVRAADLNDLPVIVRLPRDDTSMITYLLDFGVRGIMLPQVEDPETVRTASTHVRYQDGRSLGSFSRAARYGSVPKQEYANYVNEELALLPMIETEAGLNTAASIASLEETTALTIGPGDLAWSLDVPFGSDPHQEAIDQIFEIGAEHECPVGLFVPTTDMLDRNYERAAFLIYSSDVGVLTSHYQEVFQDYCGESELE